MSTNLRAGELRNHFKIYSPVTTSEGSGDYATTWTYVGDIWGSLEGLSSQERFFSAQTGAISTHKIKIRHTDLITVESKLVLDSREFFIISMIDPDGINVQLDLTVVEKAS